MINKILVISCLIVLIFIASIYTGSDIDDLIRMPNRAVTSIKKNISENQLAKKRDKLTKERDQLIIKFGGQEKVNELYKNSSTFCLNDLDCLVQDDCCCGTPVNNFNYKPKQKCYGECMSFCGGSAATTCNNNKCEDVRIN